MAHIQWKDRYSVHYKEIDAQHRSLLAILNEIVDLLAREPDGEQIGEIFHSLCQYALTHFATEERYLEAAGYPGLVAHRALHAAFIDRLLELNQGEADSRLLAETLVFVKSWLLDHILKADQDYAPVLKAFRARAEIKGILFDFGSVLGRLDERPFLEALGVLCDKAPEALEPLLGASSELGRALESGAMAPGDFLQQASIRCGRALAEGEFRPAFSRVFTPDEAILDLVRSLKAHYKVGLLAQTSAWRFRDILRPMAILPLLDAVTLSWEVGALKPDPSLWGDALAKLGLMAEECVYVDGQGAFALAATEHLLHGLAYTSPAALVVDLQRLKVQV